MSGAVQPGAIPHATKALVVARARSALSGQRILHAL
jgi:hypothetical protein